MAATRPPRTPGPRRRDTADVKLALWAVLALSLYGSCHAVKNISMSLPEAVAQRDLVTLRCDYDLEGQSLYSIKWFRGESEFYQYVPKEDPATKVFDVDGAKIKVDLTRSDANRVTIQEVERQPPAYYRCEVSADAPTFHTAFSTGLLTVVVPPSRPPTITVDKSRFNTGDLIHANCSVAPAYPLPNITWLLDDTPLSNLVEYYTESLSHEQADDERGERGSRLESVLSTVQITGDRNKMTLRCLASLYSVYRQASPAVVLMSEGAPKPAPVRKIPSGAASGGASISSGRRSLLRLWTSALPTLVAILVVRR